MNKPTLTKMERKDPLSPLPINCFTCSKHGEVEGFSIWDADQKVHTYCKNCMIDAFDGLNIAKSINKG